MVGTLRAPREYFSISSSRGGSFLTSKYSALLPKAARAFSVYGQPVFPKMSTLSSAIASPFSPWSLPGHSDKIVAQQPQRTRGFPSFRCNGTISRWCMSNIPENDQAGIVDADAVLVRASQQGDLSAFEALVSRHQKRMLNIAFRLTGEYEDACEVVQDAFVSAYRNLKGFRQESKFSTWLTSIAVNLSKNRLKRMQVRRMREPRSLDDPIRTADGELLPDPPSSEPSTLDRLEQQEAKTRVQDCIQALEPDFREVIILRDMQDHSYEEIGAMLRVAAGTVKSRLFRAREAVKECLKKTAGIL